MEKYTFKPSDTDKLYEGVGTKEESMDEDVNKRFLVYFSTKKDDVNINFSNIHLKLTGNEIGIDGYGYIGDIQSVENDETGERCSVKDIFIKRGEFENSIFIVTTKDGTKVTIESLD